VVECHYATSTHATKSGTHYTSATNDDRARHAQTNNSHAIDTWATTDRTIVRAIDTWAINRANDRAINTWVIYTGANDRANDGAIDTWATNTTTDTPTNRAIDKAIGRAIDTWANNRATGRAIDTWAINICIGKVNDGTIIRSKDIWAIDHKPNRTSTGHRSDDFEIREAMGSKSFNRLGLWISEPKQLQCESCLYRGHASDAAEGHYRWHSDRNRPFAGPFIFSVPGGRLGLQNVANPHISNSLPFSSRGQSIHTTQKHFEETTATQSHHRCCSTSPCT